MFLSEPPETNYDLRFTLAGFPVRVHPWFWLAAVLLGSGGLAGGGFNEEAGPQLLVWVCLFFVSILVHEFGHALAFRWHRKPARIVMYMFGGLAIPDVARDPWSRPTRLTAQSHIMISLAGPVAGFVFAAFGIAVVYAAGGEFQVDLRHFPGWQIVMSSNGNMLFWYGIANLLWINIFWGLLNLLPIFPLDGGQIAHAYLTSFDPRDGQFKSLQLSFITALVAAVGGYVLAHSIFMALLFGSLAYSNYMAMRFSGGGFGGGPW